MSAKFRIYQDYQRHWVAELFDTSTGDVHPVVIVSRSWKRAINVVDDNIQNCRHIIEATS